MEEEGVITSGLAYTLLLSCPSGLSRSEVSVEFKTLYDRKAHPDSKLEDSIHEIWNQRTQQNSSLYNGQKFRYAGYTSQRADGSDQVACIRLHLGLTDYRTFVGTNLNPLWERFLVSSEDDIIRCQHTSSPLGNGAIVESADQKILVLQRSQRVGEFPGYFVFPGGHSEPFEVGISAHEAGKVASEYESLNDRISQEMFDGIIREVVEEIGIPASSLMDPIFIGISRRMLNVRPTAFFYVKSHMKSDDIQQVYSLAQDGYESTQLYAFSKDDMNRMTSRMPGCHRGGFALYQMMLRAHNGGTVYTGFAYLDSKDKPTLLRININLSNSGSHTNAIFHPFPMVALWKTWIITPLL